MRQAVSEPEPPPRSAIEPPSAPRVPVAAPSPEPRPEVHVDPERKAGFYAATRDGKKKLTAPLWPADHKRFKFLSLEIDKTAEELLVEAISDVFVKYGKPPITEPTGQA
jgi:hypothetical protein